MGPIGRGPKVSISGARCIPFVVAWRHQQIVQLSIIERAVIVYVMSAGIILALYLTPYTHTHTLAVTTLAASLSITPRIIIHGRC